MPIHLIKNNPDLPSITPIGEQYGTGLYYSGYWRISEDEANALIGDNIYFHRHQRDPSFSGGVIKCAVIVDKGRYRGRIVFIFKIDPACVDIITPRDGWAQVKKIIW